MLEASLESLLAAIGEVAETEGPIHQDDLMSRLAVAYGDLRVGQRIARHLNGALATSAQRGAIVRRGEFVYLPEQRTRVRSRAGTGIPAERIAPEEYQDAVMLALADRGARQRPELVAEIRAVLGFSRTGPRL